MESPGNAAKVAAVVVALALGGFGAYELSQLAENQETANCIADAQARYPVQVVGSADVGLAFRGSQRLTNVRELRDSLDRC